MIREIDGLLSSVDSVNQQVLNGRRERAIQSIEAKIAQLKSELDSIRADSDTRNAILTPFQAAKGVIEHEESIQRIAFQEGEHAEDLFQNALDAIENKRPKPADGKSAVARKTRTVCPATLNTKTFLETPEDVDEFLDKLRVEMEEALKDNARIRIQ
ncbi:MAG: hypothetical protein IPM25_09090 [Chloracidobacterium sp.]|nr:hypothetical protein [Chloracidobacterium sp.]